MPADMEHALRSVHDYLVHGTPVPASAGQEWPVKSFQHELENDLPRGTSANHRLLWAVPSMLRGKGVAIAYLADRCRYELDHALGLTEAFSPSYWALHRWAWLVVEARAPTGELRSLAREWLHRDIAVSSLCSAIDGGQLQTYTPGQRDDQALRRVEEEMLGLMLDLPHESIETPSYWQWVVKAARALPGLPIALGLRLWCRNVVHGPGRLNPVHSILSSVRLMAPLHYEAWAATWVAWIERGTHGQDPPLLGVSYDEGVVHRLHPFPDGGNPVEGGWWGRAERTATGIRGQWRNRGNTWEGEIRTPGSPPSIKVTIGGGEAVPTDPVEPTEPEEPGGWPPGPLGPEDPNSRLAMAVAHLRALAQGRGIEDLEHAQNHLDAWERERR